MPEEVKNNAAEQAAQAQKQPVPMPTTYEALRHDLIASGRAYDFDMIDRAYQLASAAHAPSSAAAANRISATQSAWHSCWWNLAWIAKALPQP